MFEKCRPRVAEELHALLPGFSARAKNNSKQFFMSVSILKGGISFQAQLTRLHTRAPLKKGEGNCFHLLAIGSEMIADRVAR